MNILITKRWVVLSPIDKPFLFAFLMAKKVPIVKDNVNTETQLIMIYNKVFSFVLSVFSKEKRHVCRVQGGACAYV